MTRWRMWFSAAMGLRPTVGVFEAMNALDRRSVRRVTRLTHRGKVLAKGAFFGVFMTISSSPMAVISLNDERSAKRPQPAP